MRTWNGIRVGVHGPIVAAAVLALALLAAPARAADFTVNALHDDGTGTCLDGECTLREALAQAGSSDRVILPAGAYQVELGQLELQGDTVRLPGTSRFVELEEGRQLPVGTVVDTLKGRVTLMAAGGQTATFYAGIFRIGQGRGSKPLTTLTLVEKLSCTQAGSAIAAANKKKKRRLWGDGSGRFRTKGKHSAATVVGTKWLVEDRCRSTLTRVVRGRVSVRDFVKKKTVIVRAGKKYVAKRRK